jgi:hypothetical protein
VAAVRPGTPGIREFTAGATWTAPPGITQVTVEAWGGGGGGGGGAPGGTGGGGGGGGGAYQRSVLVVSPGVTYEIVIGQGGTAGDVGRAGTPGGVTEFRTIGATRVLHSARPGQGGGPAADTPGSAGAGGRGDPAFGIARDGGDGATGTTCPTATLTPGTCLRPGSGGAAGSAARGSVDLPGSSGRGGTGGQGGTPGRPGASGHVIRQW